MACERNQASRRPDLGKRLRDIHLLPVRAKSPVLSPAHVFRVMLVVLADEQLRVGIEVTSKIMRDEHVQIASSSDGLRQGLK